MSKETIYSEEYRRGLEITKVMPRFYIGQEVETDKGKGIIVGLNMPYNGLYISTEQAKAIVWFSMDTFPREWVTCSYSLSELNKLNPQEVEPPTNSNVVFIDAMFSEYANVLVGYTVFKTVDSILSGNKKWQKKFKRECLGISKEYPEIQDSAVREQMAFHLDKALSKKGFELTTLDDFNFQEPSLPQSDIKP